MSVGKKFQNARDSLKSMSRNEVAALLPRLGTPQPIPADFTAPTLCVTFGDMWTIQADYHHLNFVLLLGERDGQTLRAEQVLVFTANTWMNAVIERDLSDLIPTMRWPEGSYGAAIVAAANDELRGLMANLDAQDGESC